MTWGRIGAATFARRSAELVRPAAGAVKHGKNLSFAIGDAIGRDVGSLRDNEFARPCDPARPAHMRLIAQGLDGGDDPRHQTSSRPRTVACPAS